MKWIPVTERLPEDDLEIVLVTVEEYPSIHVVKLVYRDNGEWVDAITGELYGSGPDIFRTVEAWMPLPEPYKVTKE